MCAKGWDAFRLKFCDCLAGERIQTESDQLSKWKKYEKILGILGNLIFVFEKAIVAKKIEFLCHL